MDTLLAILPILLIATFPHWPFMGVFGKSRAYPFGATLLVLLICLMVRVI